MISGERFNTKRRRAMKMRNTLFLFVLAAMAPVYFGTAEANLITGDLWKVSEPISQNAILANVPATTPDVTFDVNSPINFFGTSTTVATWLGNGSAFNIAENTPGTLSSLMDNGSQGTLLEFKGFVTV